MTQISLIRPIEMPGQTHDHQKSQARSRSTDNETATFDTHYGEASAEDIPNDPTTSLSENDTAPPIENSEGAAETPEFSDTTKLEIANEADPETAIDNAETDIAEIAEVKLAEHSSETAEASEKGRIAQPEKILADNKGISVSPQVEKKTDVSLVAAPETVREAKQLPESDIQKLTLPQKGIEAASSNTNKAVNATGAILRGTTSENALAADAATKKAEPRPDNVPIVQPATTQRAPRSKAAETVAAVAQRLRTVDNARTERNAEIPATQETQSNTKTTALTPAPTATPPVVTVAQATISKLQVSEKDQSKLVLVNADPEMHSFELKPGAPSSTSQIAQQSGRAAMPPTMMTQLVEIARAAQDKPVHVSLNPEELGKVRMSVAMAETGVTLLILAEKPETLDLMRRNMDQITREMASAGFTNLHLSFGEGQGFSTGEENTDNPTPNGSGTEIQAEDAATAADQPTVPRTTTAHDGSLDLRL